MDFSKIFQYIHISIHLHLELLGTVEHCLYIAKVYILPLDCSHGMFQCFMCSD